jgi:2-C-methyl-D-erythritol 4-phosphate cytidylyltransferase
MRCFALIAAAGRGTRFASERPKQYAALRGKPVVVHAIERVAAAFACERALVLLAPDDRWYAQVVGDLPGVAALACGAASRAETVRNGLAALATFAADADFVLVHDGVRPCVDRASLSRLRDALADDPVGGLLAVPVAATLKRDDGHGRALRTEAREGLWAAQTPQMFRYGVLRAALARDDVASLTDEAQAVEALGHRPRLVEGSATNIKVTFADDLALAEAILAQQGDAAA